MLDLYIHVPKAGGTSLRKAVFERYGPENSYVTNYYPANILIRADRQRRVPVQPENSRDIAVRGALSKLPELAIKGLLRGGSAIWGEPEKRVLDRVSQRRGQEQSVAIIGHFTVEHFALREAPDTRLFTVVRDPLERMVSHYRYLQQSRNVQGVLRRWTQHQTHDLPFNDFALDESVQDFQTRFTGTDTSRYELLGTTDKLGAFLTKADLIETADLVPHANRTQAPSLPLPTDPGFIRDFQAFHASDYAFYETASDSLADYNLVTS